MDIFNQLHMTKVGDLTELSCGWGIIRMDRNCLFWSFNGQKIDIYGAQFRRICLIPNINVFFCWFLFQISWMPSTILFWSKNPWLMKGFKAMRVLRIPRSQSHKALDLDQNSVTLTMTGVCSISLCWSNDYPPGNQYISPPKRHFWRWFSFSPGGIYDRSLECIQNIYSPRFLDVLIWSMFFLFLASFQVIPRIPHPSLVCPDHRENRGPWGLVGKKTGWLKTHKM